MDWRQGALYPHKRICGRLLELGDSERVERPRLEPASFVDFFHDYEVRLNSSRGTLLGLTCAQLIVDVGGTLQKRPVMFADDESMFCQGCNISDPWPDRARCSADEVPCISTLR
jgi:hypothetical protein